LCKYKMNKFDGWMEFFFALTKSLRNMKKFLFLFRYKIIHRVEEEGEEKGEGDEEKFAKVK
jgi:hypothetical protein